MLNEPRGPGQIPPTGRFRHLPSLTPSSSCCWSQRGEGREGQAPLSAALPFAACSSLLPAGTPVESIQLFPGSRHSGRDRLFEELAWRQEGNCPDSGRLLQERWQLCAPFGAFGEFCSSSHGFAFICCSRGHSWLQESSAWRPREQVSLSARVPAFQMEFTLNEYIDDWPAPKPTPLPFLAFLSQKLTRPLVQHPPQSQSQGSSHPQVLPKAAPATLLPLGMPCAAFPAGLTPSSFCHQEIIVPDNALKQLLFQ